DDVYDFLSHFENYPRFMSYVQKVEVNDQGGLSWTVQGPARINFHWNTSLGRMIRNKVISWQSSDNSLIRNSGDFQLKDLAGEGTELQIELSYAPPVGALGYAVVHYLGFDPKERIDEDLQVLKSLIEKSFSPDVELADFHRA
ncbi:MAG: SRPBCC family protein, partial [Bdellovibrionia bacterium]